LENTGFQRRAAGVGRAHVSLFRNSWQGNLEPFCRSRITKPIRNPAWRMTMKRLALALLVISFSTGAALARSCATKSNAAILILT
jgi:hypothetical protein